MVDAVVSFVVERLGDYLIREAVFLGEVKNKIEWLKKELEWMLCFIEDAEQKQVDDALIRQWLSDIRDIAYDAEDVLDKYMIRVNDGGTSESPIVDEGRTSKRRQGCLASITKCSCIFGKGKEKFSLYSIGKEIEELKNRLSDASRRRESYGLENITNKRNGENPALDKLKQLRRSTSFSVEDNVVGFEDDAKKLLVKLFDEEARRMVISIVGMGGLGKTTLAGKLYHNIHVKNKFDYCAWVSVSQDYKPKDLLLRIIKSFNFVTATSESSEKKTVEDLEKKTVEDLERHLHKSLQGRSYLMVFDDVWHKEDWESLKRTFPDNKNGSRVIITTRIKEVTERSDGKIYVHELPFLSPDESWRLFCDKAFRNNNGDHKGLENLGREMVQKCSGLPLAIVVLGGLLSTKKPQEWRIVRDNIWRRLRSDSIHISHLLDLSFNDLPRQLKLCFLYLSIYPEDCEIEVEKLIRLLVAEGFISQNENQIMEDVAKDNLDELFNRSLIQIAKRRWGRVATCRIHDLLRDLAIEKARELNFIHICDEIKNPTLSSVLSSCRRQVVSSGTTSLWLQHANSLSRSLLLFNTNAESENFNIAYLMKRFSLLRVLYLDHFLTCGSYEDMGKLIHLKYFGFNYTPIRFELPPFIWKLKRLETLDLSNERGWYMKLPIEIHQFQELRHLIGNFIGTLPIENLTNLQTLKYVVVESWTELNTDKLVNLRELSIAEKWTDTIMTFTFESISKLKNLQLLAVRMGDHDSFGSLQPLSHCSCLVDLRLKGQIKKLPADMHELLPKLECLSLEISGDLEEDPMAGLEKLPNLAILDLLFNSCFVKKSISTGEGFPRLEILQLDARGLEEWQVEEGAMPMLKSLGYFSVNPELKIPERLISIPPLDECDFFKERLGYGDFLRGVRLL